MKNFLYYWLPVIAYATLIFYLSSIPIPEPILIVTKETFILHVIEYAILSVLLFRALINSKNPILRDNAILLSILISMFYGITDEIHQFFVPGRTFTYLDIVANGLGSCIVLFGNNLFLSFEERVKRIVFRR